MSARLDRATRLGRAAALAIALLAACSSTRGPGPGPTPAGDAFERLKSLNGEWVTVEAESSAPAGQAVRYHVTSHGSALIETLFAGTDHEMVTVYHRDADRLVLTHYCSAGNQPFMVARGAGDPDVLRFECQGGGNLGDHAAQHMHRGELAFIDRDRLRETWTMFAGDEAVATMRFELVRRQAAPATSRAP